PEAGAREYVRRAALHFSGLRISPDSARDRLRRSATEPTDYIPWPINFFSILLESDLGQRHVARPVGAGPRRLDESKRAHDADRLVAEVELVMIVRRAQQMRIVVMVFLPAGAERPRHRQPVADVHRVVVPIVIPPRAPPAIVRPE